MIQNWLTYVPKAKQFFYISKSFILFLKPESHTGPSLCLADHKSEVMTFTSLIDFAPTVNCVNSWFGVVSSTWEKLIWPSAWNFN